MTQEWTSTAYTLYTIKEQRKELENQEKQLSDRLRILSGNETAHNGLFAYRKQTMKGSVDNQRIYKTYNIDPELFRGDPRDQWTLIKL